MSHWACTGHWSWGLLNQGTAWQMDKSLCLAEMRGNMMVTTWLWVFESALVVCSAGLQPLQSAVQGKAWSHHCLSTVGQGSCCFEAGA